VQDHQHNRLNTDDAVHIDGTEQQSSSPLWHKLRRMRITGSTFKVNNMSVK
jgi:hypothetical protein